MTLHVLVATSNAVAGTTRRLEKIRQLADLLRHLDRHEVAIAIAFLSGRTTQGRLGVGGAVLSTLRGVPPAPTPELSLRDVDEALAYVAQLRGTGSGSARRAALEQLLTRATPPEQDFLIRLLFGELRQGALEAVLLDAVAHATGLRPASVRRATMLAGDAGAVAVAALVEGAAGLDRFRLQVFQPVQPMLADSAADLADAMSRLGHAALEYKLDGARIQVHRAGEDVRVFSRTLRDVTPAVLEVVAGVRRLPARTLILDGEVIALKADGSPHSFQVTMRRFGRRLDAPALTSELPLTPFFFDLLLLDDEELLDRPQRDRFERLGRLVPPESVVPHAFADSLPAAERVLEEALARGHEGLMAKAPDAPYAAGSRGSAWLKVKAAHTLDLVVLAAEWGSGRRTGWLSNLHLGALDVATGSFVMLGKTFKGLTDEMLRWQTGRLLELEVSRDRHIVYVRPELVVEVAFNEVQASPQYPGGMALRFARVKRYREDKSAGDIDTVETVARFRR